MMPETWATGGCGRIDGWWNEFHRRVIQREISRVLVLNLSGKKAVPRHCPG